MVLVELKIDALNVDWTSVRVLIDTGASYTSVHGDAAITSLGIAPSELAPESWAVADKVALDGVGGSVLYRRVPASFRFAHETGEQMIVDGDVHLGPYPHESRTLPSLLGMDLLRDFRFTLESAAGIVRLEPVASSGDAGSP